MSWPKSGSVENVSRETEERLDILCALVEKWNKKINLVAPSTLKDIRQRHIEDSAQLFNLSSETARTWVDLGSGGGFPGLVIAILANDLKPTLTVTLIESDARKTVFLRTAARELDLAVQVTQQRIEHCDPQNADVVSARALAPLPKLFPLVHRHMAKTGHALLPKGAGWRKEVASARASWHFNLTRHDSLTDPDSAILEIRETSHV